MKLAQSRLQDCRAAAGGSDKTNNVQRRDPGCIESAKRYSEIPMFLHDALIKPELFGELEVAVLESFEDRLFFLVGHCRDTDPERIRKFQSEHLENLDRLVPQRVLVKFPDYDGAGLFSCLIELTFAQVGLDNCGVDTDKFAEFGAEPVAVADEILEKYHVHALFAERRRIGAHHIVKVEDLRVAGPVALYIVILPRFSRDRQAGCVSTDVNVAGSFVNAVGGMVGMDC